jgi:hypothetical protein
MQLTLESARPRAIVIETIEAHLRRSGSSIGAIHAFMRDLGYTAIDDERLARRLELNAVFVPA